ncbi:MAG: efflux RND transporter permease subunit [Clostridium sp.]|nr:efflux RND transporter permease subunit [Bacteroides sp.]MCM1197599.1 efflux RND transporter permease subunit [Clostridium sp.]
MLKTIIERPVAVTMVLLIAVVLGIAGMRMLPVSLVPDVDVPVVTVQAESAGMSAREMDESVLKPLRQQLVQINGLQDIVTEAKDGSGTISLTFSHGADIDYLFIEANEKVDRSMSSLPGIQRPKVLKSSATDIPAFYINMTSACDGQYSGERSELFPVPEKFMRMSSFASEVVAKRIEQLDEVAMVDISGLAARELLVIPDMEALKSSGIGIDRFEELVRSANVRLGSLVIRDGEYRFNVKFVSYAESRTDIENLYFKVGDRLMQVKDVAEVVEHPAGRTGLVRSDGRPAVSMAVIKQSSARMSELKDAIEDLLGHFRDDYPDVEFTVTRDQTQLLDYSIDSLVRNIVFGILLAVLVIFLFMRDFRSPLLVAMTIPAALIFSMLVFYVIGLGINIISLSGLILGVGMMVDNTIILVDNITGHWTRGEELRKAVVDGTVEVMGAMLSSVLTTCAVFIPLIFVNGIAGAIFYDQAMSITVVLLSSYAVTVTVIPVYYYMWYRKSGSFRPSRILSRISIDGAAEKVDDVIMGWFLRRTWLSWTMLAVSVAGASFLFMTMEKEKLPPITSSEIMMEIDWNEPLSVEQNEERVARLEDALSGEAQQVTSFVGVQQFLLSHGGDNGMSQASIYMKCADSRSLERAMDSIGRRLRDEYPKANCGFEAAGNIFEMVFAGREAPLLARLRPVSSPGLAPEAVLSAVDSIARALPWLSVPRVPLKTDVLFVADAERMALYGVSYQSLVRVLRSSLNQNSLFDIVQGERSVPVVLGTGHGDLAGILENTFVESRDAAIPVSGLMRRTYAEDFKTIVSGTEGNYYPVPLDAGPSDVPEIISAVQSAVQDEGNFEVSFSGSYFTDRKMVEEMLLVLAIAIVLLYLILASQFESLLQPVIILSEVAIDIFFCLLVLKCLGMSINLMSMIGLVVICGIVINDSILKIDTINRLRRSGMPLEESIMTASRLRLKAILMTSLTTVLSVLPFLARGNMGADLQFPMSAVIVAGMLFGTFVSLFVVPALYCSIYRRR